MFAAFCTDHQLIHQSYQTFKTFYDRSIDEQKIECNAKLVYINPQETNTRRNKRTTATERHVVY